MPYHQNSAGHGGRRCETARKTEVKIHGHHQEGHQKECPDGRQHSRPQELEIGSVQGDPLTWKSLQGEKVRNSYAIQKTKQTRMHVHIAYTSNAGAMGTCIGDHFQQ